MAVDLFELLGPLSTEQARRLVRLLKLAPVEPADPPEPPSADPSAVPVPLPQLSEPHGNIRTMTTLNWRTARELRLTDKLIPDPNNTSVLISNFNNVQVALEAGWLHIDPRRAGEPDRNQGDPEFDVFTVPATSVERITFREAKGRRPEVHSA